MNPIIEFIKLERKKLIESDNLIKKSELLEYLGTGKNCYNNGKMFDLFQKAINDVNEIKTENGLVQCVSIWSSTSNHQDSQIRNAMSYLGAQILRMKLDEISE